MSADEVPDTKAAIRAWWAACPMTYGMEHGLTEYVMPDGSRRRVELGSREFFDTADEIFYYWNRPRHEPDRPFGRIFDYERYRSRAVLEIGCGMGCMAMNWTRRGARLHAIDLNPVAVAQTRRRFEVFGLDGDIREADGETLPFDSESFDFVYSWGVLHHTPGIRQALQEVRRVLRPGGRAGVMLYNRDSFLYRYMISRMEGDINGERRFLDPLALASRYTDGDRQEGNPHTWPVTKAEIRNDLFASFSDVRIDTFGTDVPWILDQWLPGLGSRLMPRSLIEALSRRYGWSLWITAQKP